MLGVASLALGGIVLVLFAAWIVGRLRGRLAGSADRRESYERHREAQGREPPVDLGDVERVAVEEFTEHHSGERQAVAKVEGFVVFVEDLPRDLEVGDVIEIEILSFNRGHTSATARYRGRA
ncbi:Predicted RNA-binding protein, contains TRAM domain [Halobiforma haloterrestris]|uniref:Predicted RNA-binding protein, contains TRAM domain n=1 Tax=Natronobacterium haloterrestre TaxID=148448 RepID=A0A1I1D4C1_NATHA|nr:RNA-binding protein [Halobiforma haloterrestris]SFB69869.1 Predicted RNA-binding protein, contains TRAM domain [Halobiforma haloterrestris]